MQRTALSIPSTIPEGSERDSKRDFIRFLTIAKSSAAELRTQCFIASKSDLLPKDKTTYYAAECKEIASMLQA